MIVWVGAIIEFVDIMKYLCRLVQYCCLSTLRNGSVEWCSNNVSVRYETIVWSGAVLYYAAIINIFVERCSKIICVNYEILL